MSLGCPCSCVTWTTRLLWTRAVQIDPITRPTRRTNQIRTEFGWPDYSGGSVAGLHYQKPIPADQFRFSSPKTRKTRTNWNISRLQPKFPYSGDSFPEFGEETQIPVMFPLDPVRFWTDLAISHQIRWYFRQNLTGSAKSQWILGKYRRNLENYCRNLGFFAGFVFFSIFSCRVLRSMTLTDPPATRWWSKPSDPITSAGRRRVHFFLTRFRWVGSRLGTNPTRTNSWTALIIITEPDSRKRRISRWRSTEMKRVSGRSGFTFGCHRHD